MAGAREKCAYTRELIDVSSFHIDHIVPENLADDLQKFEETCAWRIAISPIIPQDFPSCYYIFDAQFGRSFYPLDRHPGPVARSWRRPFPSRGVASPQTPADRESLPATIAESKRVGPHPRRLAGALGASNPSAPFRNCTEALDTARTSQSVEQAKVPHAVLTESPSEARPERTERRTHPCGRGNEAA